MLQQRGYTEVPKIEIDEINRRKMHFICRKNGKQVFVFFSSSKVIGIQHIENLMKRLNSQNIFDCIIIYSGILTPSALKMVQNPCIEVFSENELLCDIMNHELMPMIHVMTKEEKNDFLRRTKINECDLPLISKNDKISKYFGLSKNDIIKISRKSETACKYDCYRLVI